MSFAAEALATDRPAGLRRGLELPRQVPYLPSPTWRDQVIYFLLVDRFSDERTDRPLLDRTDLAAARPALPSGDGWRWDRWARSGHERWQGGTLRGVRMRLPYLRDLGVTAVWLSPVFKQRRHLDTYHGYGIQDFLDVEPRLGARADLVDLVDAAHDAGMRVILDVIFNHTGMNWLYRPDAPGGPTTPAYTTAAHDFGDWLDAEGARTAAVAGAEDGVWPTELQDPDRYTRAGSGSLAAGEIDDPHAEHKRSDFMTLRDLALDDPAAIADLARAFKYWIALTGCDGFRIDTLKHVTFEQARNFCGSIKEFAANLGVTDFLLIGEVAGGDHAQDRYVDVLGRNLDAALDIGEMRPALTDVAAGLTDASAYFSGFDPGNAVMGSHRALGERHVSVLDDHDHVFGRKLRFSVGAEPATADRHVAAGVAIQALTLGIPCIYYGTEQALAGPEPSEREWLPEWGSSDRYLREAMFGPDHPRRSGAAGLAPGDEGLDTTLPGFGPFGTAGHHCFDPTSPAYVRIAAVLAARRRYPVLRHGRQYLRPTAFLGRPFGHHGAGELIAWSRILDDEEALCIVNPHGREARGADVVVDATLNAPGAVLTVVLSTGPGAHPVGTTVPVRRAADGTAHVEIRGVPPAEVVVLTTHPEPSDGGVDGG